MNRTANIQQARQLLGQVLHTLQDFYSHSNWIELGKKRINERLGLQENIGPVAAPKQSTCRSEACHKKIVRCVRWKQILCFLFLFHRKLSFQSFYQKITLKKCPLHFYECKNNIRSEIIKRGLLTSGFSTNQKNEDGEEISKPIGVEKCSHGSIFDDSSHQPALGGINKDTTKAIYSPRYDLQ